MKSTSEDVLEEVNKVFSGNPKFDRERADATFELLNLLGQYLINHPTERFGQALRNLGITVDTENPDGDIYWCNGFYEEPQVTLARVLKGIADAAEAEKRGG